MTGETHELLPLPRLRPRAAESNKGDFGKALLVGGSLGMTGAISLSGMAALRSGAGLVQLAVAAVCQPIIASFEPSYMTVGLPHDRQGRIAGSAIAKINELAGKATVAACGPGLGQSPGLTKLVAELYADLPLPLVCDADALNALARQPQRLARHAAARILTPHPGEFGRLTQTTGRDPRDEAEARARQLAASAGLVIVLKGHKTLITDGSRSTWNSTGNPGMATGGTGDVLTGIITALLGQGLDAFEAAQLGVYVHGLAGDLAAEDLGQVSLIARDLIEYLPAAFQQLA
jgi:ADP-dependent NAD(P)H-hydrate dehydratase